MNSNYIEDAESELRLDNDTDLTLDEYIEKAKENPTIASHSVKYILEAIQHYGTRETFEDGEEKERYVFFDDPFGDGEHAVLGNTEVLNDFVNELKRMASEKGENERIIWFEGPTATGKSELKRCLTNGIQGFAESEEGAKYTLEWSLDSLSDSQASGMTYGDSGVSTKDWYKSSINIDPLSVFPEETRKQITAEINDDEERHPIEVTTNLDPFSREAYNSLIEKYSSFEDVVCSNHLRVSRYYPEIGDGIGVLHTEDDGNEKHRLVGSWMEGAMDEFASRGRKNAQAFSYDGVLCQGNRTMSIVEDASHHSDVLDKMMNVCEEKMVKLDNKISMEIDTLLVIISNPDLKQQLSEYQDSGQADPLRALRRRMDKYEFGYLTTLSLEGLLIKRLLYNSNELFETHEERMEQIIEPFTLYEAEVAPRAIEAAAMYEVVTRVSKNEPLKEIEKVLLFENGQFEQGGHVYDFDEYNDVKVEDDGSFGIPVTYTVDVLVDLAQENDVVLPQDVIKKMSSNLSTNPMFSDNEAKHMENMYINVKDYIIEQQQKDVLEAMVGDIEVTEENVREYVDGIFAWEDEENEEYDAYELREFETHYLGISEDEYTTDAKISPVVAGFRRNIIEPLSKFLWDNRDDNFTVDDVPLSDSPALSPLLEGNDWNMVKRVFPEVTYSDWWNPPDGTQTKKLKEKTIERMVSQMDYSEKSAEEVSQRVIKHHRGESSDGER